MTERSTAQVGRYVGGGSALPDRELAHRIIVGAAHHIAWGWRQGAIACDAQGFQTEPQNIAAISWCLTGALGRAASDYGLDPNLQSGATPAGLLAIQAVQDAIGEEWIACWNDDLGRKQEEVLDALHRAARSLS